MRCTHVAEHRCRSCFTTFAYRTHLVVDDAVRQISRIVLVDDVCTEGSTLRASTAALRACNATLEVVAVTAGQMTVRGAVEHEQDLIA